MIKTVRKIKSILKCPLSFHEFERMNIASVVRDLTDVLDKLDLSSEDESDNLVGDAYSGNGKFRFHQNVFLLKTKCVNCDKVSKHA